MLLERGHAFPWASSLVSHHPGPTPVLPVTAAAVTGLFAEVWKTGNQMPYGNRGKLPVRPFHPHTFPPFPQALRFLSM